MDIFNNCWKILKWKECSKGIIYFMKTADLYCVMIEDSDEQIIYTLTSFDQCTATIKYKEMRDRLLKGEKIEYE